MVRNRHFFRRVSAAASAEKAKTHLPMIVTIGGDKETFSPKRVGGGLEEIHGRSCNGTCLSDMDEKQIA